MEKEVDGNPIESSLGELVRHKIHPYSHQDLTSFTEDFTIPLGSGGYGDVFKGKLPGGMLVAVKKLNNDIKMDAMKDTFIAEVTTMSSTSHRNLVKLFGYCFEANMKALVYEYLENGSFDKILYKNHLNLPWEKLYDIATETAKGLSYLHESCHDLIVHYDVKAGNVLLDSNLIPKVGDFGLGKIFHWDSSHISVIGFRGTKIYAAPEMWMGMPVTSKSDVYSFGMLLFEVLGRRRNVEGQNWFPGHVWEKFAKKQLHKIFEECGIEDKNIEKAKTLSAVALWCTQQKPGDRPTMTRAVQVLEGNIHLPQPPNPNYLYSESSSASNMTGGSTESCGPLTSDERLSEKCPIAGEEDSTLRPSSSKSDLVDPKREIDKIGLGNNTPERRKKEHYKISDSSKVANRSKLLLESFERRCPPRGKNDVVLYTCTRGSQEAVQNSRNIVERLRMKRIMFFTRDISVYYSYREEWVTLFGEKDVEPPIMFVKGRLIGGYDEILKLDSDEKLEILLFSLVES